ncbi:hypothetical protein ACYULU_06600, partial [Breznakiellaceae bacterium SP9]
YQGYHVVNVLGCLADNIGALNIEQTCIAEKGGGVKARHLKHRTRTEKGRAGTGKRAARTGKRAARTGKRAAKKNKDYKRADAIRQQLKEGGIILEDTVAGTTWRLQ